MLAIDTNVIVRLLIRDAPTQTAKAEALIASHDVFVTATVLLETYWVLVSTYGVANESAIEALADFAGLPTVTFDEPQRIAMALTWARGGIDFADALHLASAETCTAFVTFDRRLIRRATKAGVPARAP